MSGKGWRRGLEDPYARACVNTGCSIEVTVVRRAVKR